MAKIIDEMKQIILSDNLIRNYQLIGFFGSSLESENFGDIDFVTIGNNKSHEKLKDNLTKELANKGYKIIFFKTIKHKPSVKDSTLVHDLHYSSFEDLHTNEWKDIVNEMKDNLLVIHGSKSNINKREIKKEDLLIPLQEWVNEINSESEFNNFKEYVIKIFPYLYKMHKKINFEKIGSKILDNLNDENWKNSKDKINFIIKEDHKHGKSARH